MIILKFISTRLKKNLGLGVQNLFWEGQIKKIKKLKIYRPKI